MSQRDDLLDLATELVRGAHDDSVLLGDAIVVMSVEDLRRLVSRLLLMVQWAVDAEDLEDLLVQVELMQLRGET